MEKLAINGGDPLRERPLPGRKLFGKNELRSAIAVFEDSWQSRVDFGCQGKYEDLYTKAFCEFQGGGYADAVSSGTAALYVALSALDVVGDEVLFSPVTDPGGISPALLLQITPVIADAQPGGFNVGPDEFEAALTPDTKAAVIVHSGGIPVDLDPVMEIASSRGVRVIEDCSQAHGALYKEKRVGRFGDMAVFSTMFSKGHATGGCGGVVYTEDEDLHWRARSLADRGKPFHKDFDPKDPGKFLFPAMNFSQDELSCAIGTSTLSRLSKIIAKRNEIVGKINDGLRESSVVSPVVLSSHVVPSPFFHTLEVDVSKLRVSKKRFAEAIRAEGIWVNPDYRYVVSEWGWIGKYSECETAHTPNATAFRDRTFNLLFNERFSDDDIKDVVSCILKVEKTYCESFDYR